MAPIPPAEAEKETEDLPTVANADSVNHSGPDSQRDPPPDSHGSDVNADTVDAAPPDASTDPLLPIPVPDLPPLNNSTTNMESTSTESPANNNDTPFFIGQIFDTMQCYAAIDEYHLQKGYIALNDITKPNKFDPDHQYHRWRCQRHGKSRGKSTGVRPNRTSYKCDCKYYISCVHPKDQDTNLRDTSKLQIVSLNLTHNNGCTMGSDVDMNEAILKRRGRKYDNIFLDSLRREVKSGRYSTYDVRSRLVEAGYKNASLEEATNLRYKILTDKPIKDWVPPPPDESRDDEDVAAMKTMEDYLFNEDLANEIRVGGRESIEKMRLLHEGLKSTSPGYDYRIAKDNEGRFTGTAWQTGRMRGRLAKHGDVLWIDDTRSGVNSSGFAFWNIMIFDSEGKVKFGMGAMTISSEDSAVKWIFQALTTSCEERYRQTSRREERFV